MRHFLTKSLLFICSQSPYYRAFSTLSSFRPKTLSYRSQSVDGSHIPVSVWWNFDSFPLPDGVGFRSVRTSVAQVLISSGITGPVDDIRGYGDVTKPWYPNKRNLPFSGISFTHVPKDGMISADCHLYSDLLCWSSLNPAPAHLFIVGTHDYGCHLFRKNHYNILVAGSDSDPCPSRSCATIMWNWNDILNGENLHGIHYNEPPRPLWYGKYNIPLADPCNNIVNQLSDILLDDGNLYANNGLCAACKHRPIRKSVINSIRHILTMYPGGMELTEFMLELKQINVDTLKQFYGHKNLACFLLSIPHILRIEFDGDPSSGDVKFWVHGTLQQVEEFSSHGR